MGLFSQALSTYPQYIISYIYHKYSIPNTMSQLEQFSKLTEVVADTGEVEQIKQFKPVDVSVVSCVFAQWVVYVAMWLCAQLSVVPFLSFAHSPSTLFIPFSPSGYHEPQSHRCGLQGPHLCRSRRRCCKYYCF